MNIEPENTARRLGKLVPNPKARLREQFHEVCRFKYFSVRTEDSYWQWVVRYLKFHRTQEGTRWNASLPNQGWRHPKDLGGPEVAAFLSDLASRQQVAAATQAQALNALVFLYREVLHVLVAEIGEFERVRRPARLPEVLSREEVKLVLASAAPEYQLPLRLLYGTGLRLMELLRLRIKDVDFGRNQIMVRSGKGQKDRVTVLPESLKAELQAHLERWRYATHLRELEAGRGVSTLPEGVGKKYPGAAKEWAWQYVFGLRWQVGRDTALGRAFQCSETSRRAKAAVNAPQSRRSARFGNGRQARQRLECGGFSTALARMGRHPLNQRFGALESAVAAAALPAQSKHARGLGERYRTSRHAFGLRWQVGRDTGL